MSKFVRGKSNRIAKEECKEACASIKDERHVQQPDQLEASLTDLILNPKSNRIARPPNAFMLFARDHRKALAKKYPTHNNKNISSLLGECWRNVDEYTRSEYYKKAKMLEELHRKKYPGYVYSPRIARMQKLARKKKNSDKCGDINMPKDKEIKPEPIQKENAGNHGEEKCVSGEGNDSISEKKQPSPGYIPNNPQYFSDPERGARPEMPYTVQSNTQGYNYPSCPPPHWNMPPVEPVSLSSIGRCPDEWGARSDMYADSYYPPEMYEYGPWHRHSEYPYEYSVSSTWTPYGSGCQGECSMIHTNDEHSSCSHFPPTPEDLQRSYYHYNLSEPYRNYSYPCSYGPYLDSPMPFRSRRSVPYKITPPKSNSAYFSHSMNYYHNQYEHHYKEFHPKYPYPTQPMDYPPIQEIIYSSEYPPEIYNGGTIQAEINTESRIDVPGADSLVQDQDVEQVNTMKQVNTESRIDVPSADSLVQNVEPVNTESDDNRINDAASEEVIQSANPELGHVAQNVIVTEM